MSIKRLGRLYQKVLVVGLASIVLMGASAGFRDGKAKDYLQYGAYASLLTTGCLALYTCKKCNRPIREWGERLI